MKAQEFRKLIREEIQKVLKEAGTTGRYYYIYFNGKRAIQGDPMHNKKDIIKLGMEPDDVKNVGPVYELRTASYTIYVITSMKNTQDVWCVINPGDRAIAEDDLFSYKVCMKAISDARAGKGKQITFQNYLGGPKSGFVGSTAADQAGSKLGFDETKVKPYKVGTGNRSGMLVDVKKLKSVLTGSPLRSIEAMEKLGIVFKSAYVNVRPIGKAYTGSGSGMTMTYSLFGTDAQGNDIIYDKYEGNTAGGGQAFVFVNGKKQKASVYLNL